MDPVSGDLLVVERTQVTRIARGVLEAGLNQAMPPDPTETTRFSQFFPIDAGDGIAVDRCTGDIYLSKRGNGEIVRYERSSEEFQSIVAGLLSPSRLLALYRVGGSCPLIPSTFLSSSRRRIVSFWCSQTKAQLYLGFRLKAPPP